MADYDPSFGEKLFDVIKYRDAVNPQALSAELMTYFIVGLLLYHGYRKYGAKKIALYFLGGFLLTVCEENFMILKGFFTDSALYSERTYFYNYHLFVIWIAAVPLAVMASWFILTYSSFQIAERVIPENTNRFLLKRLLLAGWLGMSIDFVIDPIVIRDFRWIWLNDLDKTVWFLQVPITNYLGFFMLVISFNWFFVWYWERFVPKHPSLAGIKGVIAYFPLTLLPFCFTVIVIVIFAILSFPLYGIDFSWWSWPW
jgi:uncharacterized membrane protein